LMPQFQPIASNRCEIRHLIALKTVSTV
jgi:hypothetical protein